MKAEIFYTDHSRLNIEKKANQKTLDRINKAIATWEAVTQYKIRDENELAMIVKDPAGHFIARVKAEQQDAEKGLRKILGQRANIDKLMEDVFLPADFGRVKAAFEDIAKVRWNFFSLQDGKVVLSQAFFDALLGRCFFVIETDIQRKRLEYAKKLIEVLTSSLELLRQEIKEAGKSDQSFWREFTSLSCLGALPVGVRLGFTNKYEQGENIRALEVDPYFVTMGFSQTIRALQIHKPAPQYKSPDYRIVYKRESDGSDQRILILDGDDVPLDTMRTTKSTLTPNIYHVRDGRIINTGKRGKRYPEHALVNQE